MSTVLLVAIILAMAVAGLVIVYFFVMPLRRVTNAALQIAGGQPGVRVRPRPSGPVATLADAFNEMAERLEAQVSAASQERSRLAATINSSIDGVAALDREGRIVFANVALERLFGRARDRMVGESFVLLLPDEKVLAAIRAARDRGEPQIGVVERPGRQFLQVSTTPIEGGGEWNVLIVCNDVTDVKRTEQIRRDFVANVSHELRTPLAGLKSVVETLSAGALQDESVAQEFLRRADHEVERLVQLVEELLELSRIESGERPLALEDTDVETLLREAIERLRPQAERSGVRVDLEVADVGRVKLDPGYIERALINLLHNALKFTPQGGSVSVRAYRQQGGLTVEVRDTGVGIASSDLPRIFERFYKVDHSRAGVGTGLGLALVKHAVEAHGGRVHVHSEPGKGSVFGFTIPDA